MRALRLVLLLLLALAALLPPAAAPVAAAGPPRCFALTGQCAEGAFLAYWTRHGGLDLFGYPLTPPIADYEGRTVQVYQRAIMEWHPDNAPAHRVLLTRLGDERLGDLPVRTAPAAPCGAGCSHFAATGHTLRGVFARTWAARGGLTLFGYPITEEFWEGELRVQYFERARFEHHPAHAGTPHEVQLGLLGAEALAERPGWPDRPAVEAPATPILDPGPPTRLLIPALGVDAAVLPVTTDADGSMSAPRTAWETTWFAPGARPGQTGNAVIAGHVDFAGVGPAVFRGLSALAPGDAIWVIDAEGARRRFLVERIATYRLGQVPLEEVFGATADANLNLITCTGTFDPSSRGYDQRVVVYTRWDGLP